MARHDKSTTRRAGRRFGAVIALAALAVSLFGFNTSSLASSAHRTAAPAATNALTGKKVLVVPFWLDAFGTAFADWIKRTYQPLGVSVTVFNANAVATRQLDELDTAIASGQYAGIIWQPIDVKAATTTIRAIQNAKIAQVVFNAGLTPGQDGVTVPQLVIDEGSLYSSGQIAANYIKAHPNLGAHTLIAWLGSFPPTPDCDARLAGLLKGAKSVDPQAKVVFNQGAASAAQASTKTSDLVTTGTKFNVFDACGSTQGLPGIAALQAAGLAGAVNKVPQHVFIMSQDATPPELQQLWDPKSAHMVSALLPARDGALAGVKLLNKELNNQIPITSPEIDKFGFTPIQTNCTKYRALVEQQYQGVKGLTVPACPK